MHEFELKFQVPAAQAAAVEAALRRGKVRREHLRARYFDTPEEALARSALVLRIRQENRRWVQAVKGPGGSGFERLEHEVPLPRDPGAADIALHAGHPVHELLVGALDRADGPLQPVLETDITRLARTVRAGATRVEIALDRGQLVAGGHVHPVLELEFELKEGDPLALVELAQQWCETHGLWLDPLSKSAQGRRLGCAAEVAATRWHLQLRKGEAMLPALLDAGLRQVLGNARELAAGVGGDQHVHQLRVGIRRLRTTLRELESAGAWDAAIRAQIEPALQALFGVAGAHRDGATLLPALQAELSRYGSPMPAWTPALPDVGAAVRQAEVQSALLQGVAVVEQLRQADAIPRGALRRLARERLDHLHRRVLKQGRRFATLAADTRHQVRKRLKRLRYLAELVRPLFPGAAVDAYVDALGDLQDALGRYQDAVAARALLERHAADEPTAWFGAGLLAAREEGLVEDCARACRSAARHARPFWN